MPKNTLIVSDIFQSLQGEGPRLGAPSVFLRLGMCNLQCSWCDTPYTWKEGELDCQTMGLDEVIETIQVFRKDRQISNLVITGGEPLLQQVATVQLLLDERMKDLSIEFETNGSQMLSPELEALKDRLHFNISPKLADSGNKPYKVQFYPNSVLKFVYVGNQSEELIDQFLEENEVDLKRTPVFIMPEGTSAKAMSEKTGKVMAYCMKRGFRMSPRLHIYLFGNQRGT